MYTINKHLKSQSAIEFIILASFMFLVIVIFFKVTSSKALEAKDQSNGNTARDIAEFAYREIQLAKSLNNGYKRSFVIPQTIDGTEYTIKILDNRELIVNYLGYEYVKFLPSTDAAGNLIINGNLVKGQNTIEKKGGVVYITSP